MGTNVKQQKIGIYDKSPSKTKLKGKEQDYKIFSRNKLID